MTHSLPQHRADHRTDDPGDFPVPLRRSRPSPGRTVTPQVPRSGSPLDQARAAFAWLTCEPAPLALDGRGVRGLPPAAVALDELRDRLRHPSCRPVTRDAVWAALIRRARRHGDAWTIGCVGVALPDLTALAARLSRHLPTGMSTTTAGPDAWGRRGVARRDADIESAIVTGFLTAVADVDLTRPAIAARLLAAAQDTGRAARREITRAPTPRRQLFTSTSPPAPARHPDLVLARAVTAAALTHNEAALIGATRLQPLTLARIAAARGTTAATLAAARVRAERKLAVWLRDTTDPTTDSTDHPSGPDSIRSGPVGRRRRRSTSRTAQATAPSAERSAPTRAVVGNDRAGRPHARAATADPEGNALAPGARRRRRARPVSPTRHETRTRSGGEVTAEVAAAAVTSPGPLVAKDAQPAGGSDT